MRAKFIVGFPTASVPKGDEASQFGVIPDDAPNLLRHDLVQSDDVFLLAGPRGRPEDERAVAQ